MAESGEKGGMIDMPVTDLSSEVNALCQAFGVDPDDVLEINIEPGCCEFKVRVGPNQRIGGHGSHVVAWDAPWNGMSTAAVQYPITTTRVGNHEPTPTLKTPTPPRPLPVVVVSM